VKTYFLFYKARAHFWSKSNKFQCFRYSKTENKIQIFDDKKTFDKQNKLQKGVIFLKVRILNFCVSGKKVQSVCSTKPLGMKIIVIIAKFAVTFVTIC